jgi:hypothetical protein
VFTLFTIIIQEIVSSVYLSSLSCDLPSIDELRLLV